MRAAHGVAPLRPDKRLQFAAGSHAFDMARRSYFSHDTPEGIDLVRRAKLARWVPRRRQWRLGEVLAMGCYTASTPAAAVQGWMDSPGHKDVMLDAGMRRAGIAVMDVGPCSIWVMDVGVKRAVTPS